MYVGVCVCIDALSGLSLYKRDSSQEYNVDRQIVNLFIFFMSWYSSSEGFQDGAKWKTEWGRVPDFTSDKDEVMEA